MIRTILKKLQKRTKRNRIYFIVWGSILYLIQILNDLFLFGNIHDRPEFKFGISYLWGYFLHEVFYEKNKIYNDNDVSSITERRTAPDRLGLAIVFCILYLGVLFYTNK